jgi:glucosamine 6-phosphate synthetase-like amidotransferase/phosphosugar isomerase protein
VHNAHPHLSSGPGNLAELKDKPGRVALVHNGIIENHDELRAQLQAKGYVFTSQTDTEVISHWVDFTTTDLLLLWAHPRQQPTTSPVARRASATSRRMSTATR